MFITIHWYKFFNQYNQLNMYKSITYNIIILMIFIK